MTTQTTNEIPIDTDAALASVAGFFELWNAADESSRRAAITRTYREDACFSDPTAQVVGHDAIDAHVAGTMTIFEGRTFRLVGEPDIHHDRLMFRWAMDAADGSTELLGIDLVHLAPDGRFADSTGFFLPAD